MSGSLPPTPGELLRTHRIRAGLSQDALSQRANVSVRTISDLERGQRASAHLETLRLLGVALALDPDDLQRFLASARRSGQGDDAVPPRPPVTTTGPGKWAASFPRPAGTLFGRDAELAQLALLLGPGSDPLVTLTGPGGVGKTRLAVQAAHAAAPRFAEGAAFVDLATLSRPEQVPDAIANLLGIASTTDSVSERLVDILRQRSLLLVLDNLEHLIEAAPFVAELAAASPAVQLLVTSRVRLRVSAEHELPVEPLHVSEPDAAFAQLRANGAIQLFSARAQAADRTFTLTEQNAPQVAELCDALEGIPLAIELAASRLRVLPLEALIERIDLRLPLLTGGNRDRPQRQQSMRATIAWSYELLDPVEQRFLRWLAPFIGGCSLSSAEALGRKHGLERAATLETLSALVESGLLRRTVAPDGSPRFQPFETVREFAWDELALRHEVELARAFHALHFLEFAESSAPRPDEPIRDAWLADIAAERSNVISAFDFLCQPEFPRHGIRFAAALGPFWFFMGPVTEARPRLLPAIALAPAEPTVAELHARCWAALLLADADDHQTAREMAQASMALADQIGSPADQACALQALAWVEEHLERWDAVRALFDELIVRWVALQNEFMQAVCLMLLGGIDYAEGDLASARSMAAKAGTIFVRLDEPGWAAGTYWYEGMFAAAANELDQSSLHYTRCLRLWLQFEDTLRWFKPLVGLADIAAALGDYQRAAHLLGSSDELLRNAGMALMPFDKPAWDRAVSSCRQALGDATFDTLRQAGHGRAPDAWLADADAIIALAHGAEPWQRQT